MKISYKEWRTLMLQSIHNERRCNIYPMKRGTLTRLKYAWSIRKVRREHGRLG